MTDLDKDTPSLPGVFPGAEIVRNGLRDLARGDGSLEAHLVSLAAPRLKVLGFAVPPGLIDSPEIKLYRLLEAKYGHGAHSKYNAYTRRLVRFLRAVQCARSSTQKV